MQAKLQEVLRALVIDTDSDHNTQETAQRVAKMYLDEVFRGRYVPMPAVTEFPNAERLNELMIVGPITVRSACSHHMCPIFGKVWIGILPNEHSNLIGLTKYARITDWIMSRPQIQEEAVTMLANELQRTRAPRRPGDRDGGRPFCMHWRGVKDTASSDGQQRDARRVPEGPQPAARIPVAAAAQAGLKEEPRCSSDSSTPAAPSPAVDQDAAGRHPAASKANNPALGITGVLCFSEGIFLQVLEGGRSAVNRLYNRIAADPRHSEVELLCYEEIGERRFAGWSMGAGQHGAAEPGDAAEVFGAADARPVSRCRARCRWRCSKS